MPNKNLHFAAYAVLTLCFIIIAHMHECQHRGTATPKYDAQLHNVYAMCAVSLGYLAYEAWGERTPKGTYYY